MRPRYEVQRREGGGEGGLLRATEQSSQVSESYVILRTWTLALRSVCMRGASAAPTGTMMQELTLPEAEVWTPGQAQPVALSLDGWEGIAGSAEDQPRSLVLTLPEAVAPDGTTRLARVSGCRLWCSAMGEGPHLHRTTSGAMLKRRSSFPRRTSSSRGDSVSTASCSSLESARGRPLTLTMMSPSWMPPLPTGETRGHLTSPLGLDLPQDTIGFNNTSLRKTILTGEVSVLTARLLHQMNTGKLYAPLQQRAGQALLQPC